MVYNYIKNTNFKANSKNISWQSIPSMLTPRQNHAMVSTDKKVYAISGLSAIVMKLTSSVEAYDPATKKWATAPSLNTARLGLASAVLVLALQGSGLSSRAIGATGVAFALALPKCLLY